MGSTIPKAMHELSGIPLVVWAVESMMALPDVEMVVVAAPADYLDDVRAILPEDSTDVRAIAGGVLRQDTVRHMLAALPPEITHVLVHDAARCLAPTSLGERVAASLKAGAEAAIPVLPVVDTVARVDSNGDFVGNAPRDELRLVQTPQGFDRELLTRAHAQVQEGEEFTDDASLVARLGAVVHTVTGDPAALKITTSADLQIAAALAPAVPGIPS